MMIGSESTGRTGGTPVSVGKPGKGPSSCGRSRKCMFDEPLFWAASLFGHLVRGVDYSSPDVTEPRVGLSASRRCYCALSLPQRGVSSVSDPRNLARQSADQYRSRHAWAPMWAKPPKPPSPPRLRMDFVAQALVYWGQVLDLDITCVGASTGHLNMRGDTEVASVTSSLYSGP